MIKQRYAWAVLLGLSIGCADSGPPPGSDGLPAEVAAPLVDPAGSTAEANAWGPPGACCFGISCPAPQDAVCCRMLTAEACLVEGGAFMGVEADCGAGVCAVFFDLDSDGDGLSDAEEVAEGLDPFDPLDGPDIDGDGIPNGEDDDVDGDGFLNVDDVDIDGDGILNVFDIDDDGDGLPDFEDPDDNADGVVDFDDEPQAGECDGNGDCGRGEICAEAVIAGAILNQCEEPKMCADGAMPGDECAPNRACDQSGRCLAACSRDGDCPSGEVCRFNACLQRTCTADDGADACRRGEVCDGNVCRPECSSASDCRMDEVCGDGDPPRCVPMPEPEDESEASADDTPTDESEATADDDGDNPPSEDESEATAEDDDAEESEDDP